MDMIVWKGILLLKDMCSAISCDTCIAVCQYAQQMRDLLPETKFYAEVENKRVAANIMAAQNLKPIFWINSNQIGFQKQC